MKENKRIFTTEDFKKEIVPLINEGLTVPLVISGGSREPFLAHNRDTLYISKPVFPLKKGDMAFYERECGRIVMHRVYKAKHGSYFFVGDAQTAIEGPISEDRIFGEIRSVCRKGKTADKKNFVFWLFSAVWIRIVPLRPFIMKVYRTLKKGM